MPTDVRLSDHRIGSEGLSEYPLHFVSDTKGALCLPIRTHCAGSLCALVYRFCLAGVPGAGFEPANRWGEDLESPGFDRSPTPATSSRAAYRSRRLLFFIDDIKTSRTRGSYLLRRRRGWNIVFLFPLFLKGMTRSYHK